MAGQFARRGLVTVLLVALSLWAFGVAAQTGDGGSVDENKAIVTAYLEALSGNEKPTSLLDQYVSENDLFLREHIAMFEAAFPRYELITDDMIAEADKVVVRATFRGTHQGEFAGIAPTEREVEIPVIIIYRMEDGLIAETWLQADAISLMQQLGALPAPEETPAASE